MMQTDRTTDVTDGKDKEGFVLLNTKFNAIRGIRGIRGKSTVWSFGSTTLKP
jgi:hypothetical protein